MLADNLARDLYAALAALPIVDSHSHIDPFAPTAKSLDDLLGYHYYTELAHSAGMSRDPLKPEVAPRERCQAILNWIDRYDNTAQYAWILEIARTFLGFTGDRLTETDCDWLFDASVRIMGAKDWESTVVAKTKLEKIFLTNQFDDRLDGFDAKRYVPCLRTDDLVFHLHDPAVRSRLAKTTGTDAADLKSLRTGINALFDRFTKVGARACAISLPPGFAPSAAFGQRGDGDVELNRALATKSSMDPALSVKVFWMLAEGCREFGLPFDLMIGVNRRVYREGVYQGQDLFDQRTSLIQYADLFNAFPNVPYCISVLSSPQNQELVSYAWIFPNVLPHGHWWYSNIPAYIEPDLRARLAAVPKTKLLGYYSDAYKLEFVLPKYNMYKSVLAKVLAEDFVKPGRLSECAAVELGTMVLRGNVERVFGLAATR